jgi:hypothetical protein
MAPSQRALKSITSQLREKLTRSSVVQSNSTNKVSGASPGNATDERFASALAAHDLGSDRVSVASVIKSEIHLSGH